MQDVFHDEFGIGKSDSRLARIRGAYLKWGGALLSLMVLGLLVFWAYQLGTRDPREIPVIRAMDVPMRVQPADPGGTRMANQGLEVNDVLAGNEAQSPDEVVLAPAAETPPIEQTLSEAERLRNLILRPEAGTSGAGVPEAAEDAVDTSLPTDAGRLQPPEDTAEATEDAATAEEDPADLVASLVEQAVAEPEPESAAPVRPVVRPRGFDAAPADAAPAEAAVRDLPSGTRLVQLGAFESEAQAAGSWFRLQRAHEDLLGERDTVIQRAESNGRVFHRLRVLGFAAQEDQRAMCDALQARDVECIPVTVR